MPGMDLGNRQLLEPVRQIGMLDQWNARSEELQGVVRQNGPLAQKLDERFLQEHRPEDLVLSQINRFLDMSKRDCVPHDRNVDDTCSSVAPEDMSIPEVRTQLSKAFLVIRLTPDKNATITFQGDRCKINRQVH